MAKKDHKDREEEMVPQEVESKELATTDQEEKSMTAVSPALERLVLAVEALPPEKQVGVRKLAELLNPQQEGFGEIEEVRYRSPVIKIRQRMTNNAPKAADIGDLYSADTGEIFSRPFGFIPIFPYENRARFRPGEMKPDCRSEDCKVSIHGDDCSKCPTSPWKNNQAQDCNNSFNLIAANLDFSKLYHLQFSKTSYKVGVSIIRQARNAGQKPWQRLYELDTSEVKGNSGPYHVFTTSFLETSDPDFHETSRSLHDFLSEQRKEAKEAAGKRLAESRAAIETLDAYIGDSSDGNADAAPKGDFTDL